MRQCRVYNIVDLEQYRISICLLRYIKWFDCPFRKVHRYEVGFKLLGGGCGVCKIVNIEKKLFFIF